MTPQVFISKFVMSLKHEMSLEAWYFTIVYKNVIVFSFIDYFVFV
jgi:hypothetical protein